MVSAKRVRIADGPWSDDPDDELFYPSGDGQPMAETPWHLQVMIRLYLLLQRRYAGHPGVYVGANMLLYWRYGDRQRSVAPDVFMARGVTTPPGGVYRTWVQGAPPSVVFEITSSGTAREDRQRKKDIYAMLGVRDYVLFDPLGEYLRPPLQVYRLAGNVYAPVPPQSDGTVRSGELGVHIRTQDDRIDLIDLDTGEPWLTDAEAAEQALTQAQAAGDMIAQQLAEEQRLRALAEQRAVEEAQLRAIAERHALEQAEARAEAERVAAEAEQRRHAEAAARAEAEARAEALLREIEELRRRAGLERPEE